MSNVLDIMIYSAKLSSSPFNYSSGHFLAFSYIRYIEIFVICCNAGFFIFSNISKVEDFDKCLKPQAKQTAGKDFVYPLSKRQKPETQNEELSEQQLSTSVPKYIQSFVQRINLIYSFLLSVPYTPLLFKSWMLFIFG